MGTNPPKIYCILHGHGLALCCVQTDGRKQNQNQNHQCAKMCFKDPMKSKPIVGGFFVQRIGKEKACWSFFVQNGVSINMVAVQLRAAC
jgi:hypothetical protein